MSSLAAERDELKSLLRGLLISSPRTMTAFHLQRDYREQEGRDVPFRLLGYNSFIEYLQSIPDTVKLHPALGGNSPIVVPVQSEKSSHVDALVQKQKVNPSKRTGRTKAALPRRRSVRPLVAASNYNFFNNYSSWNSGHNTFFPFKQQVFVPNTVQQRIYRMLQENPKGMSIQTVKRELISSGIYHNYGNDSIEDMLNSMNHILKIHNGMVYPFASRQDNVTEEVKPSKSTSPSPTLANNVTEDEKRFKSLSPSATSFIPNRQEVKLSNSVSPTFVPNYEEVKQSKPVSASHTFIPAGYEGNCDFETSVVENFEDVLSENEECDVEIAKHTDFVCNGNGDNIFSSIEKEDASSYDRGAESKVTSPVLSSPTCDTSEHISEKMRNNFRLLLNKHPYGILCSELPDLYKEEFSIILDYRSLGYMSIVQLASDLPDVFHCIRLDGTDWKLFDARKELPTKYSSRNIKADIKESAFMLPKVPPRIQNNIERLLAFHPAGLSSDQFLTKYMEFFQTPLSLEEMGFDTVESLLLFLNDTVLHVRYVNQKILVYPHAKDYVPEPENPLPHLTQVTISSANMEAKKEVLDLFQDLYPPEVIGPKDTLSYEKIPPEVRVGSYLEVLVAEVYTPRRFWIQLRGENTNIALDRVMNEIQIFYDEEAANQYYMPDVTIRIGQYCMAPYNREWHRARIQSLPNAFEIQVLFLDYGTISKVNRRDLRFMHRDFSELPMQAIEASLANLKPSGDGNKWPRSVSRRFLELVSDRNLIATVSSINYEARKLEVALVDTTGSEDIHINDLLKQEGLAEYETCINHQTSPKRVDKSLSPITVRRPPPGFDTEICQNKRSRMSPPGLPSIDRTKPKSAEVLDTPYLEHNLPTANKKQPRIVQQPPNITFSPPAGSFPVVYNQNPFMMTQNPLALLYEHYFKQQHLLNSVIPNSALTSITNSLLANQVSAAAATAAAAATVALVNPFAIPMMSVPVMYQPPPFTERLSHPEMDILEVSVPSDNSSPVPVQQTSPSIINHGTAAAESFTSEIHSSISSTKCENTSAGATYITTSNVSKESPHAATYKVSSASVDSVNLQMSEMQILEIPDSACVTSRRGVMNRQMTVDKAMNRVNSGGVKSIPTNSRSSDINVLEDRDVLETTSQLNNLDLESDILQQEEFERTNQAETLEFNSVNAAESLSEEIYFSEEENYEDAVEGEQGAQRLHYVKRVELAKRVVHLINWGNIPYLCTDELVRLFTDFSGRHVVLKILDSKGISVPFIEIGQGDAPDFIQEVENCEIQGVPRSSSGHIVGKVHLIPLNVVSQLLTLLSLRNKEVFAAIQAAIENFANDEYWAA